MNGKWMILPAILAVFAWYDIRKKEFPIWLIILAAGTVISSAVLWKTQSISQICGGILVGVVLLLLSFCGGGIGAGDGILFMITGVILGGAGNLGLLFLASLLAGAAAVVMLVCKKSGKKAELPFAPFVLAASLLQVIMKLEAG